MDNQKQKKKKSVMDTLSATMVLVLSHCCWCLWDIRIWH